MPKLLHRSLGSVQSPIFVHWVVSACISSLVPYSPLAALGRDFRSSVLRVFSEIQKIWWLVWYSSWNRAPNSKVWIVCKKSERYLSAFISPRIHLRSQRSSRIESTNLVTSRECSTAVDSMCLRAFLKREIFFSLRLKKQPIHPSSRRS